MPFVYRYINIPAEEVVYIGKVTSGDLHHKTPLADRHKQHQRENWYKQIGNENLLLQFIPLDTHADADIYETLLISRYAGTGQLVNKAKTQWGKATCVLRREIWWINFEHPTDDTPERIGVEIANYIYKCRKNVNENYIPVETAVDMLANEVKNYLLDLNKKYKCRGDYWRFGDFMRYTRQEEESADES